MPHVQRVPCLADSDRWRCPACASDRDKQGRVALCSRPGHAAVSICKERAPKAVCEKQVSRTVLVFAWDWDDPPARGQNVRVVMAVPDGGAANETKTQPFAFCDGAVPLACTRFVSRRTGWGKTKWATAEWVDGRTAGATGSGRRRAHAASPSPPAKGGGGKGGSRQRVWGAWPCAGTRGVRCTARPPSPVGPGVVTRGGGEVVWVWARA